MPLTRMTKISEANEAMYKILDLRGNTKYNPNLQEIMNTPYDVNNIQPRNTNVWNYNAIGFDTNGKWHNIFRT